MGIFFLIGILVGVFIVLGINGGKAKKYDNLVFFIILALGFTIIAFIGYSVSKNTPEKLQKEIQEYNELKIKVECVQELKDPNLKKIFDSDLKKEVLRMNRRIRANRDRYDSWIDGYIYDRRFGDLEELVYE